MSESNHHERVGSDDDIEVSTPLPPSPSEAVVADMTGMAQSHYRERRLFTAVKTIPFFLGNANGKYHRSLGHPRHVDALVFQL